MFQEEQCSTWMLLVLYQALKVTPGNLELSTAGKAATVSPLWAGPRALISRCGKKGLEGRFSLLTGSG